jgi:hypothetical protein
MKISLPVSGPQKSAGVGQNFKVAKLALMRRIVVVDLRVHQIGRKIVIMQLGVNLLFALHPCGF